MRINKIFAVLFCWLSLISANAFAQSDPVNLLQHVANNMIAGLKANHATLKTKPQIVYSLAYKHIVPYADISAMARRVLPPEIWNNATPTQRLQFQKQFTTTLIRTYSSALSSYKDQTVRFYPIRGDYQGLKTVEVNGEIDSSESQPIQVTYRLLRVGSVWKLYDLSVEGVSMLESFRSQFADILSQGNMQQLLDRMSTHNQAHRG